MSIIEQIKAEVERMKNDSVHLHTYDELLRFLSTLQEQPVCEEQIMKSPLVSVGYTASEELQRINYENGRKDMKEQMMKEAVERIVKEDAGGYPYIDATELYDYTEDKPLAKKGDKVRIVIVKED